MPIAEPVFFPKDPNFTVFEYEFRWPKSDFKPRRRLSIAIEQQANVARDAIRKDVAAFIRWDRDAVPAYESSPDNSSPVSTPHITGRVFVSVKSLLEGSGYTDSIIEQAGKDAYDRVKLLLTKSVLEGDEPW